MSLFVLLFYSLHEPFSREMENDYSGTPARFARRPTASPNPDFFSPAILKIKKAFRLPYWLLCEYIKICVKNYLQKRFVRN